MERTPRGETESVTAATEIILSLSLSPLYSLLTFFSPSSTPPIFTLAVSGRRLIETSVSDRARQNVVSKIGRMRAMHDLCLHASSGEGGRMAEAGLEGIDEKTATSTAWKRFGKPAKKGRVE